MIALSLSEIRDLTGGVVHGTDVPETVVIDGPVTTDSRDCGPGSLYVARVGETADGHDFVASAVSAGAVAALASRPVEGVPCVLVDDVHTTGATLHACATALRDAGAEHIAAITWARTLDVRPVDPVMPEA